MADYVAQRVREQVEGYYWPRATLNERRATDAPGFWARSGYHNDADPGQEQRYAF